MVLEVRNGTAEAQYGRILDAVVAAVMTATDKDKALLRPAHTKACGRLHRIIRCATHTTARR